MKDGVLSEERTPDSIPSVKLLRNAKGGTQIEVKIYNENPDDAETKARKIYDALCKDYPYSN